MATGVRDKYHVALNGKGYMLRGAPAKAAYSRSILPSQVSRLAVSDLAYSDFAGQGLFYLAQTDWSGGNKGETIWRDDAKYYYASNIDAKSVQGSIKIASGLTLENDFVEDIQNGGYLDVGGTSYYFIGTSDGVYRKSGTWSKISSGWDPASYSVSDVLTHKNKLWITAINATSHVVVSCAADGSAQTDHTASIETAMGWTAGYLDGASCMWENGESLFVGLINPTSDKYGIVKTNDNGSTWVAVVQFDGNVNASQGGDFLLSGLSYGSQQFYLINKSFGQELRIYNISTSTDLLVNDFYGSANNMYKISCSRKFLHILNGKLIITIPHRQVFQYDLSAGVLSRIFKEDDYKYNYSEMSGIVSVGGIANQESIYWQNLIYDGEVFFNNKRAYDDSYDLMPILSNGNIIYWRDIVDTGKLYYDNNYKSGSDANFLLMNEMSPISAIDKLLCFVTIIFDTLATGQSIKIEYSINNRTSFINCGTASYTNDGAISKKTFSIPGNIIFNKIWFKIYLNSGGTTSPTLHDIVMAYRPMPDYKSGWSMRLNFSDQVRLLNGQDEQREGYELLSELWKEKMIKQRVILEDIDYAETYLTGSMSATATSAAIANGSRLPRQGRIRAVSGTVAEEMYYTSAYQKSIKGITRGAHGTIARAYTSGQVLDNGYHVYIEDIKSEINFTDEKKTESIAQVVLIEA